MVLLAAGAAGILSSFTTRADPPRQTSDAPTVSRSAGPEGGVIVLWPRIVPGTEADRSRELAESIQKRLETLARRVLPGRPVDVRPAPQRVCRRAGCRALSLGALLARRGNGCAVVILVAPPGPSPARMIPAAGKLRMQREKLPFRKHPESYLTIQDFSRCSQVMGEIARHEGAIQAAIHHVTDTPRTQRKATSP